jgi:CubicO group peptidase (beta-lactamase class C family)
VKKIVKIIGGLVLLLIVGLYATGKDYLLKGVRNIYLRGHKTAFLADYKYFENDTVFKSTNPQPWPKHPAYNTGSVAESLEDYHQKTKTVAFVVIQNDSVLYEKYYENYGPDARSNSFSMVKSMVSAALGKAIMEGAIESLDQPVIDFIPELKGPYAQEVSVGNLSAMASGQNWDEAYYSPFSVTAAAYFVDDLPQLILDQPIDSPPNQGFKYLSGTTQLLGMVIEKATGQKLAQYMTEKFWQPLGAEHDAYWQVDSSAQGNVKAYCCFASNALDFARFGKLYKDYGRWGTTQVLDSTFVVKSLSPIYPNDPEYGYGWWLDHYKEQPVFMMRGHLGQYVIVLPEQNTIVVRLGHLKGDTIPENPFTEDIYVYIDAALELVNNAAQN